MLEDAGYSTTDMAGLANWRAGRDGRAIVAAVQDAAGFEALRRFRDEHPFIPVVAVLAEVTVEAFAVAMRAGATAAVHEEHSAEMLSLTLRAALEGHGIAPLGVLQAMAARVPETPDSKSWLSADEAEWIRTLAAGGTVADLAGTVGYSEREMFRNLRDTYTRLGVRNRTEAIIWATRHGLIQEADSGA